MKGKIFCPHCLARGQYTVICKYEDVVGRGFFYPWCRRCRREIPVKIEDISIDG